MNVFKKIACGAAVALSMMGSASAASVMNNWVFNPTGSGFATGQTINEYLDITGNAFINLTPGPNGTFTFQENAVFRSPYADNGPSFAGTFGRYITATFSASGSGTFSGAFQFNSGTINIYSNIVDSFGGSAGYYGADQGTLIATFDVEQGGGGRVDANGDPTGNGEITVLAKAKAPAGLAPGYWYRGNGDDLSSEDILSFAFTNANTIGQPTAQLVREVACQFANFGGPGCPTGTGYSNVPGDYFFVSNNGQFKLADVPEPGSLALFGIALLGVGFANRKRAAKQA